jgi:hypothetical protein
MYENTLKNPVQNSTKTPPMPPLTGNTAAEVSMPPLTTNKPEPRISETKKSAHKKGNGAKKQRVYKSRKIVPEHKVYVEYTDRDVLLGRGGHNIKHVGNIDYRAKIEETKPAYRAASKDDKTGIAELVVQYVHDKGGRFLEKETDKDTGVVQWFLVPDITARTKAGQALREENTPESREMKRTKYNYSKSKKKS